MVWFQQELCIHCTALTGPGCGRKCWEELLPPFLMCEKHLCSFHRISVLLGGCLGVSGNQDLLIKGFTSQLKEITSLRDLSE